jgi:hypothetical protein
VHKLSRHEKEMDNINEAHRTIRRLGLADEALALQIDVPVRDPPFLVGRAKNSRLKTRTEIGFFEA